MQVFISIDDTDNQHSPGSGHLAEVLSKKIIEKGFASCCSTISRHQLFQSPEIPLTSHNSAMCFSIRLGSGGLTELVNYSGAFLEESAASGSDPGLCVVSACGDFDCARLVEFGLAAKSTVLTKDSAYGLAGECGVHLSEHGGTGDGVIGALAGVGLRMQGSDGRVRGWLDFGAAGSTISVKHLTAHPDIEGVIDQEGCLLTEDIEIFLTENRLKTILSDNRQVVPVLPVKLSNGIGWQTMDKAAIKMF